MSCGRFDPEDFADFDGGVCLAHVLETALASKMRALATERACIVCNREVGEAEPPFAISFKNLLAEISAAIHRHYVNAETEGVPWDSEEGWYMGAPTYQTYEVVNDICYGPSATTFPTSWRRR